MKFLTVLIPLALFVSLGQQQEQGRIVCYYDSTSFTREGLKKMTINDLQPALQFCSHLVYGYAGINAESFKLISLNESVDLDKRRGLFRQVTSLKSKYPKLKILLGLGGGHDKDQSPEKYLNLLESSSARIIFINSAYSMIKSYSFDGLDLGWQFPQNKPKKRRSAIGQLWKSFKKSFTAESVLDEKADEHKEAYTSLVRDLKDSFRHDGYTLSMTVLPNVNTTLFFDVEELINNLDFVNLAAFDWNTPAQFDYMDYPAPIYELNEKRHPEHNINAQVQLWLNLNYPPSKLNIGIPTYGRIWEMAPPISDTTNELPPSSQSQEPGLLSYSEVCSKLRNSYNFHLEGEEAPLCPVRDLTKRFGSSAYRVADESGNHGLWLGYEDPDTAGNKASYTRSKGLGGMAIFDLSNDDFRGTCTGDKFPILRAVKFRL